MSWFREDPTDSLFSSPLLRVTETESSPILQTITRSTLETLSYTQMWIAMWYSVWYSNDRMEPGLGLLLGTAPAPNGAPPPAATLPPRLAHPPHATTLLFYEDTKICFTATACRLQSAKGYSS